MSKIIEISLPVEFQGDSALIPSKNFAENGQAAIQKESSPERDSLLERIEISFASDSVNEPSNLDRIPAKIETLRAIDPEAREQLTLLLPFKLPSFETKDLAQPIMGLVKDTGLEACGSCSGCTSCSGCSSCSPCSPCSSCSSCSGCTGCSGCSGCTGCTGCTPSQRWSAEESPIMASLAEFHSELEHGSGIVRAV